MNTSSNGSVWKPVISAGLMRGKIEIRHSLRGPGLFMYFFIPAIYALVIYFMNDSLIPGTEFSLGAMVLPGIVGMSIALGGITGPAGFIAMDREDGTLLRAKATPNGMMGYLIGKIIAFSGTVLLGLLPLVIPAMQVWDQLIITGKSLAFLRLSLC